MAAALFYDLKGNPLNNVRLSSADEICAVELDGPRVALKLACKEIGEVQKITTSFGRKEICKILLHGQDDTLVKAEAWGNHGSNFTDIVQVGTAFAISFVPKPCGSSIFLNDTTWIIRINSEVKIAELDEAPLLKRKSSKACISSKAKQARMDRERTLKAKTTVRPVLGGESSGKKAAAKAVAEAISDGQDPLAVQDDAHSRPEEETEEDDQEVDQDAEEDQEEEEDN
jgi:hypothetical protein